MATLPEEILQSILNYLQPVLVPKYWEPCPLDNRLLYRTLSAICRVSKAFHRLALPFLYNTVEIYGGPRKLGTVTRVSGCRSNIRPLLRSLIRNASLTDEIRDLKVEDWQTDGSDENASKILGEEPDLDSRLLCEDVVLMSKLSSKSRHRLPSTSSGLEDRQLALLLLLCVNVEYLEITAVTHMGVTYAMNAIREAMDRTSSLENDSQSHNHQTSHPLSKLRELAVRNQDYPAVDSSFGMNDIGPLLRAPSLEIVRCYLMYFEDPIKTFRLRRNPSVTTLHIDRGALMYHGVKTVFAIFPNIRHLRYSTTRSGDFHTANDGFGESLQKYGSGLESFSTDCGFIGPHPIADFTSLERLRRLTLPWKALAGTRGQVEPFANVLPTSLEVLEVLRCDEPVYETGADVITMFRKLNIEVVRLMSDPGMQAVSTIRMEKTVMFEEDVEACGWSEDRSGEDLCFTRAA